MVERWRRVWPFTVTNISPTIWGRRLWQRRIQCCGTLCWADVQPAERYFTCIVLTPMVACELGLEILTMHQKVVGASDGGSAPSSTQFSDGLWKVAQWREGYKLHRSTPACDGKTLTLTLAIVLRYLQCWYVPWRQLRQRLPYWTRQQSWSKMRFTRAGTVKRLVAVPLSSYKGFREVSSFLFAFAMGEAIQPREFSPSLNWSNNDRGWYFGQLHSQLCKSCHVVGVGAILLSQDTRVARLSYRWAQPCIHTNRSISSISFGSVVAVIVVLSPTYITGAIMWAMAKAGYNAVDKGALDSSSRSSRRCISWW